MLTTEQVQLHFGVGRPRLSSASNAGRLRVFSYKGLRMYSVDQLVRVFGPPRRAVPIETTQEFVSVNDLVLEVAEQQGISEDAARQLVEERLSD